MRVQICTSIMEICVGQWLLRKMENDLSKDPNGQLWGTFPKDTLCYHSDHCAITFIQLVLYNNQEWGTNYMPLKKIINTVNVVMVHKGVLCSQYNKSNHIIHRLEWN